MIIDCDTHYMPRDAFDRVPGNLAARRPILQFDDAGIYTGMEFAGRPVPLPNATPLTAPGTGSEYPGMCDMEARLKDYVEMGIERTCLLAQFSGWWSYLIEPELATAMAHSWNLSVLELQKKYPKHVSGIALVALQDADAATRELAWAKDNGFGGVALDKVFPVHAHAYSEGLGSQKQLWPFFRAAENLDMPIFLHTVQHGHRVSNSPWFQKDGLDFFAPNEGQMSLVSLFTSGLLDAYPRLKFIFTEAGTEFIKPLVERLDRTFGSAIVDYDNEDATPFFRGRGPGHGDENLQRARALTPLEVYLEKNRKPARHYFKNNFFFTIETEEAGLPDAIEFLGAERFLFATDYPHDDPGGAMKFRDVQLLEENKHISDGEKERMKSENAREFLNLDRTDAMLRSFEKVFRLLDAFTIETPEWSLAELSRNVGMAKPTVHHIMATLIQGGWIDRDPATKRLRLGVRLWEKGWLAINQLGVRDVARPYVEALSRETGETARLGILDAIDPRWVLYIDRVESLHPVRAAMSGEVRSPSYSVATGKALLAHNPELVKRLLAQPLLAYTNGTLTSANALLKDLALTSERGYSVNQSEFRADVVGIAAPIWSHESRAVAAIGISGPAYRLTPAVVKRLGSSVAAAGRDISKRMGFVNRGNAHESDVPVSGRHSPAAAAARSVGVGSGERGGARVSDKAHRGGGGLRRRGRQ